MAVDDLMSDLTAHPRMYGRVSRAPHGRVVRRAKVGALDYVAAYEVTATEVIVLSVKHARSVRRPWRERLP